MLKALVRRPATVRLVNLDIFATGVFAFECARNSLSSALVYSRRIRFLGFVFLATRDSFL